MATAQQVDPAKRYREGRILVKPRAGTSSLALSRGMARAGGRLLRRLPGLDVEVVAVPPGSEERIAREMASDPSIEFAEVDVLVEPLQIEPDDPLYPNAWHLRTLGAPDAWPVSLGDGVTVAILDSGVDASHPDLADNVVAGWNTVSDTADHDDYLGHGTRVAGAVAALSNNTLGVASVAWNARIMPMRVTNRPDGAAFASDIARGLVWAADRGARVANISYDVVDRGTVEEGARYMKARGGVVVIAAGNTGADREHPASDAHIAVASTTNGDGWASFSSFGDHVDLSAPGVSIWTTSRGGTYLAMSGTSFSAPVVAGVAALVIGANSALTADEVEAVLRSAAVDLGDPGWDPLFGHGRIDAAAAVALAVGGTADTTPPSSVILAPAAGAEVAGTVSVEMQATDDVGVAQVALYVGGVLVGTDDSAPYQVLWDSTAGPDGITALVARAVDAAGNEGESAVVEVTVANQPAAPPPRPRSLRVVGG